MNLVKLALWTAEPFRRLKWLAAVIESKLASFPDGDDIGDVFLEETTARLTQLRQMRSHGASYPQSLRKILEIFTSRPVLTMIQNWMYQGILNDPFNEFFIIKNDLTTLMRTLGKGDIESLKPDDPHDWDWDKQYLLVHARIPPFICQKIALEILSIGKGVNFMRQCCGDVTWINTSMAKFLQSDSNCRAIHIDQLLQPIDRLYKLVNDRLVSLMLDKFHLMEHMEAIRGYVFLGQGDLVQTLTDSLAHELNLPPGRQYRHNFLPAVDAAFKTSSASSWPAYLQECCDILIRTNKNLAPERPSSSYYNPKDGWDTVELFYKLSSPISAVIGNKSLLQQYRLVFRFLWRLKRTEHILVNTWRVLTNCSKQLLTIVPEISGLLHLCHMTRHEMVCFSNNIQYYFMCEVLESSWQTLQQKVYSSLSLDEIVNSYNFYISTIVKAIFFDYTSVSHPKNTDSKDANKTQKTLSSMILEISDVIREFCHQCEMLYSVSCEIASFSNPEFRENLEHTDRYKWGVTGEDEAVIQDFKEHLEKILTVELNTAIDKYKQVFRQFLTTLSYEVKKGNNAHLRYLFQRINYNSYYTLESRRNQFASTISPTVCSTTISNSMLDAIKGDSPLNAKINSATAETPKNP
ncbi:gamma-tubulin complex component 3 homolog [Schistocerca gregaria]|uniref:gamma-tubulin complex component 3 homolog n=1 Tax=Schistocerca gregaria TaxID=7010 RepID=UPI00211E5A33|nr:gamma-tubulin complex component 3 homolog [Schistocerca gregaria]